MPLHPYNGVRPRLGQRVFLAAGHLALGVPARVARPLTDEERRAIGDIAERYVALKDRYLAALGEER